MIIENAGHESIEKIKLHQKELVQFLRDSGLSTARVDVGI